jgi:hypothetical protein
MLGIGSVNTPVVRQWLSSLHVITALVTHTTIEELLEWGIFCAVRAEIIYNEDQS